MALQLHPRTITRRADWAEGLFSLTFDAAIPLRAGQFVTVSTEPVGDRTTRRAYSVASGPGEPTELLVVEVDGGRVSPMLSATQPGDTLYVSDRGKGLFTLDQIPTDRELWLIATGTGVAPYRSMLRSGQALRDHRAVVVVYGVREPAHLAYLDELRELERDHGDRFRLVTLCTRTDPPPGGLRGRVTERLADGALEAAARLPITPERSHVLLCGNPAMIEEMTERLGARGLERHTPRQPGQLSTERYW